MLKPCGTIAAYQRHRDNKEDACRPCKDAHNTYNQTQRTPEFQEQLNMTPKVILDYVETFQPVSLVELITLIQSKHDRKERAISRAVFRMILDRRLLSTKDMRGRIILEVGDE